MQRLYRLTYLKGIAMLLNKISLSNLRNTLIGKYDLFICSSSFEDRCLSIARNIESRKIKRALIVSNTDLVQYVGTNKNNLDKIFGTKGRIVDVSTTDPLSTADNLHNALSHTLGNNFDGSILLDVTAFTHEALLIILRLLQTFYPKSKITGAYSNAIEYGVGDDMKHKWLSRGVGEVRSVLGYPGIILPSRKMHLILIVGYEHERAAGIIESIEPNSIALGYGRSGSATTEKDKDANEHYMHLVEQMATSYCDVNRFEIPCNDPEGTCKELQAQVYKASGMNVAIAPMNNKLSTIGAAWAAFSNNSIQLCYAKALQYNYLGYSRLGSDCYLLDLSNKEIENRKATK
jgi:hypothetical protein